MKVVRSKVLVLFLVAFMCLASEGLLAQTIPNHTQVRQNIEYLNKQSPIQLDYNSHVQAYVDVYTNKRRDHLGKIIGRSQLYFPLFEQYLAKYDLPLELKYLAIVESALDPKAKSSSAAMGLWQFLYPTSIMFNLKVTSFVDERCDPVKSTEAACLYLQYLFRNFNDWQLALAAYNVGVGEVKKAIAKSGGKTRFWDLAPYLPEQARGYVPAFIAANYAMTYYASYQIQPEKARYLMTDLDSVVITRSLTLDQIAKASNVSLADVEFLNPQYIKNYVPVNETSVKIVLPVVNVPMFLREVEKLGIPQIPQGQVTSSNFKTVKIEHVVARGEYFHKIAMQYNCNIEDIMAWNKLTSKNLNAGQRLTIWQKQMANSFFFIKQEVDSNLFVNVGMDEKPLSQFFK